MSWGWVVVFCLALVAWLVWLDGCRWKNGIDEANHKAYREELLRRLEESSRRPIDADGAAQRALDAARKRQAADQNERLLPSAHRTWDVPSEPPGPAKKLGGHLGERLADRAERRDDQADEKERGG